MLKVTTESGAVYFVDDGNFAGAGSRVTGGSKHLEDGRLLNSPVLVGKSMRILAPERSYLNPHFTNPGVLSTPVIKIEPAEGKG